MTTDREIYAFSLKWIDAFTVNHISFVEETMGDECDALGFDMASDAEMERLFPGSTNGARELESIIGQINDVSMLGGSIYAKWRYYQHWACSPWDTEWFLLALNRLRELTESRTN